MSFLARDEVTAKQWRDISEISLLNSKSNSPFVYCRRGTFILLWSLRLSEKRSIDSKFVCKKVQKNLPSWSGNLKHRWQQTRQRPRGKRPLALARLDRLLSLPNQPQRTVSAQQRNPRRSQRIWGGQPLPRKWRENSISHQNVVRNWRPRWKPDGQPKEPLPGRLRKGPRPLKILRSTRFLSRRRADEAGRDQGLAAAVLSLSCGGEDGRRGGPGWGR